MGFLRRRSTVTLPDDWVDVVAGGFAHWALLDAVERERLGELMAEIVKTRRWEAAAGFELTGEARTVIAAGAALVVLGLDPGVDWYRGTRTIIVHRTTLHFDEPQAGPAGTLADPAPLVGQARHRGPVIIAWDTARANARNPFFGEDVTIHEFAHKLDMLDDVTDGTPPIADAAVRERWADVCTREYDLVRAGLPSLLRPYAGVDPGEFFAVATETFFTRPVELEAGHRELYDVLRAFYGQDPAARVRRFGAAREARLGG